MTIMYTIGIVLLSLAFALSFYNILLMFERRRKIWLLPVLVVTGCFLLLMAGSKPRLDRYYEKENPASYEQLFPNAFNEGYNKAIEEAVLVTMTKNGYILSFNGEEHFYYNK